MAKIVARSPLRPDPGTAEEAGQLASRSGSRALRKLLGNHLAVIGLLIFGIILLASIFAPLPDRPRSRSRSTSAPSCKPPSAEHWFGTDTTGRDVFARVLYGGRISILVGLGSALIAAIIGVGIGCYAGYKGGWVDVIAMRVSEIFMSFPQIILVLLLVSIIGQELDQPDRDLRRQRLGHHVQNGPREECCHCREEEYVQALRSFGLSTPRICYKHILPNALGPIMVNITLTTAMFILA